MRFRRRRIIGPSFPFVAAGAPAAAGQVLFDALFAYNMSAFGTSQDYGSAGLNVGSGANGTSNRAIALVAMFCFDSAGVGNTPLIYWDSASGVGGQQFEQIAGPFSFATAGNLYLFGLKNPNLGQKNLYASWTGSSQLGIFALSVVGADQTGGTTTFRAAANASGNSNSPSITVNGAAASEMCIAGFGVDNTSLFADDGTPINIGHKDGSWWGSAASYSNAGASPTLTHPLGTIHNWLSAGMAIKAA